MGGGLIASFRPVTLRRPLSWGVPFREGSCDVPLSMTVTRLVSADCGAFLSPANASSDRFFAHPPEQAKPQLALCAGPADARRDGALALDAEEGPAVVPGRWNRRMPRRRRGRLGRSRRSTPTVSVVAMAQDEGALATRIAAASVYGLPIPTGGGRM